MVAHAILFIVLALAVALLAGVSAYLPPSFLPPARKPEPELEPGFEEEVRAFLAQHGRPDAASGRRMVSGVRADAVVDGAASAMQLAVPDVPSAGAPAGRGSP
jgi:hypothetical protein